MHVSHVDNVHVHLMFDGKGKYMFRRLRRRAKFHTPRTCNRLQYREESQAESFGAVGIDWLTFPHTSENAKALEAFAVYRRLIQEKQTALAIPEEKKGMTVAQRVISFFCEGFTV